MQHVRRGRPQLLRGASLNSGIDLEDNQGTTPEEGQEEHHGTRGVSFADTDANRDSPSVDGEQPMEVNRSITSSSWPSSPAMRNFNQVAEEQKSQMIIPPEDSVYSYLMFMPPIEQRRHKKYVTPLIVFAVTLVFVNFVMQTGLLYVVGQHIMKNHNEWVSTIANLKYTAWYHVVPMHYNHAPPKCHGEDSPLCLNHGDGFACAPRSVEALADWQALDIDGDDIWAKEEAENKELQEMFRCKFNVDLLSLYHTTVANINNATFLGDRRDTNLRTGEGIHKAYRDWYLHRPLLCQYGDQDMCGTLFTRGYFDEALRQQPATAFKDTASAFKYCTQLLERECFDILPNTYRVWRMVSNQQCGAKIFGQRTYLSPTDDDQHSGTPMLTINFKKREDYDGSRRLEFKLFLLILLVTFLSVMSLEMRSILKAYVWTRKFKVDEDADKKGQIVGRGAVEIFKKGSLDDDLYSPTKTRGTDCDTEEDLSQWNVSILAVRDDHRYLVLVVTTLRLLLWFFLLWSGVMFLTGPPRYLALIFDALSLVFIFEIDELLYRTMLRQEFKNDHFGVQPMMVQRFIIGDHGVVQDIGVFFFIIAFSASIVYTYSVVELNPLVDSLTCLCNVEGANCNEAQLYSKAWWDRYWSVTMPASAKIIDELKLV